MCEWCRQEFAAQKLTTRYCGTRCNSHAYQAKVRGQSVEAMHKELPKAPEPPDFDIYKLRNLKIKEAALLIGCCRQAVDKILKEGRIHALKISARITRIPKSEIDRLFTLPEAIISPEQDRRLTENKMPLKRENCYIIGEIPLVYDISNSMLYKILKSNSVRREPFEKGFIVPKKTIDKLLAGFKKIEKVQAMVVDQLKPEDL